jgi:DNA ligase D-like protein (predicted polymerase)
MTSVKTGRTMSEISEEAEDAGEVWYSKRKRGGAARSARLTARGGVKKPKAAKIVPPKLKKPASPAPAVTSMPRKVKPMIAAAARTKAPGDDWIYHPHLQGLRALAEVEGKRVHMYSKSGLPYEKRFPDIAHKLAESGLNALLDGEIVGKAYHVFDILYLDGKDLREQPLTARIKILNETLKDSAHVKLVKTGKAKGALIAKNPESTYHSGTTSEWLTVEATNRRVNASLREKEPGTFYDSENAQLTHPDKIYFPKDGYTKGDVYNYYDKVGDYMLPYLKDRPESLSRHPNGIHQAGFYQKDMTGHLPKWFKTKRIFSESSDKTIDYPMVQDKRSLLYIANLGCIEIHPWFSRAQKLDHPDFLVIDLDPDDNPFTDVIKVALAFHNLLDEIGATNFVKTSGATGIHIGIPTEAKYDFDTVRKFAESVAKVIQKKFPALTSMERSPAKRRKKIYLDCLQNRRGQTLAAPYCIRPRDGAPVSMPVTWKELTPKLKPQQFNIQNAPSRISKGADPWAGVLGQGVDLDKCLKRLERITNKA